MNIVQVTTLAGITHNRVTHRLLTRGQLVYFYTSSTFSGMELGAVNRIKPLKDKYVADNISKIVGTFELDEPDTYLKEEWGTVRVYNARLPEGIRGAYWSPEKGEVLRFTSNPAEAMEFLREEFTRKFFDRAEG